MINVYQTRLNFYQVNVFRNSYKRAIKIAKFLLFVCCLSIASCTKEDSYDPNLSPFIGEFLIKGTQNTFKIYADNDKTISFSFYGYLQNFEAYVYGTTFINDHALPNLIVTGYFEDVGKNLIIHYKYSNYPSIDITAIKVLH